jgi:hypothetical protein
MISIPSSLLRHCLQQSAVDPDCLWHTCTTNVAIWHRVSDLLATERRFITLVAFRRPSNVQGCRKPAEHSPTLAFGSVRKQLLQSFVWGILLLSARL